MRWIVLVSLVLAGGLAATDSFAARIFGDVMMDGKPVPAGVVLTIALVPPSSSPDVELARPSVADSTTTDEFGSYKLMVPKEGKCILRVFYEDQAPTLEVFSYKQATRYDLVLENKDGTLSLKRK